MRIVQVGLGGFGRSWAAQMIPQVDEVEVVGTADVSEASRGAAVAAGVASADSCYSSAEQAIAEADPDAVLVTASLPGHVPAVRAALDAGKHVMVEKPFAPTLGEGAQLVEAAQSRGLILAVSQNYRFFPAVRALRQLIGSGELGDPHAVEIDFRRFSDTSAGSKPHHALEEPLLVDMSIHHFDLIRTVLGSEPTEISCRTWNPRWSSFSGPSAGVAAIALDNGATVSYRGSWVSRGEPTPLPGIWRIEFADAELSWYGRGEGIDGWKSDQVWLRRGDQRTRLDLPLMHRTNRAGSLTEFVAAITEGRQPENSGRDNLGTLALTYAVVEAARTGSSVAVSAT